VAGHRRWRTAHRDRGCRCRREVRLRPFDGSRDYLTDFPVFDERLLALYERLHGAGYAEDQIRAFCRLFTAICRVGLKIMLDPKYKACAMESCGVYGKVNSWAGGPTDWSAAGPFRGVREGLDLGLPTRAAFCRRQ
jgi:hypothetical protein